MQIETRSLKDVLVVDLAGRLDSHTAGPIGDELTSLTGGEHRKVVLNLAKLEYVSSAGLRIILRIAKLLEAHDGRMAICGSTGLVAEVLTSSGFDSLLKIFPTEKAAVEALG
jgi:anti-anti-sigma factor